MNKAFNNKHTISLFLMPAFTLYTCIVIVSILWAGYYSFFHWNGLGVMHFAGFDNYKALISDKNFFPVVLNTLEYTILQLLLQVVGGLFLAIVLTYITKGRALLQLLYYIPVVISSVAICQIFGKLFSVTPPGVINALLSLFNKDFLYLEWISNPHTSLGLVAFVEGYKYAGLYMVISYAALIGIPLDLIDAAKIDGASTLRQLLNVKIPYIKPVLISNSILVLNGSLRSFDFSFLLTKGGPGNSSELLAAYMYKQAFTSMKYGYGSSVAIAIVLLCLVIGTTFRKIVNEGDI